MYTHTGCNVPKFDHVSWSDRTIWRIYWSLMDTMFFTQLNSFLSDDRTEAHLKIDLWVSQVPTTRQRCPRTSDAGIL